MGGFNLGFRSPAVRKFQYATTSIAKQSITADVFEKNLLILVALLVPKSWLYRVVYRTKAFITHKTYMDSDVVEAKMRTTYVPI